MEGRRTQLQEQQKELKDEVKGIADVRSAVLSFLTFSFFSFFFHWFFFPFFFAAACWRMRCAC